MRLRKCLASSLLLCTLLVGEGYSQNYTFNIGAGPGFPLGSTDNFASISYNFVTGGGVSATPHIKLDAEFMFHGIPVQKKIVDHLGLSDVKGRVYALSGNILVGTPIGRGNTVYAIAGGGWYRRTLEAKQTVFQAGTVCSPYWSWWGEECVNGIFATDVTVGSRTSSAPGFNFGGGLTCQIGDSPAHIYVEARYHLAYTRNVHTQILPLTIGLRF
jgi:Outer membrane protein beta-barrel domain